MFKIEDIPSTIPRKPLDCFVSCMASLSLVPLRTAGFELTSWTAASIATFATFPMEVLKETIAPMLTTLGLVETRTPTAMPAMKRP